MFRGISAITMDVKGRLTMPTRYRDLLLAEQQRSLVITIDTEETCLLLYRLAEWQIIESNLQKLPSFNPAARRIQRLLIGHATDVQLDNQGRFLIDPMLRKYANLDKHVVLIGQGNKCELWDETLWHTKRQVWLEEEALKKDSLPLELQNFYL